MPVLAGAYLGETYLGGLSDLAEIPKYPTGLSLLVDSATGEYVAKQGDDGPAWLDTLTWSDGTAVNLEGCTVQFVLRSLSGLPVRLTGQVEVPGPYTGHVAFSPSSHDTGSAGDYMAVWRIVFPNGEVRTAPTEGYREVRIEPGLAAEAQQLVSLTEVKEELLIPADNLKHDSKLMRWIKALTPLIEDLTGPIVPKVYDEWYRGGHTRISLRHGPHTGLGTTPVLNVLAVTEYRGPIPYDLLNVPTPIQGSAYSIMVNKQLGYIARRTSGGGAMPFWRDSEHDDQNVNVRYESGQEETPENVRMAAVEAVKWWWESTQPIGKGLMSGSAGPEESGKPMVALPYHVEAILAPTRKGPSIF